MVRQTTGHNLSRDDHFRNRSHHYSMLTLEELFPEWGREALRSMQRMNTIRAKHYYVDDRMMLARWYFLRGEITLKNVVLYLSTFAGSSYVKKRVPLVAHSQKATQVPPTTPRGAG